VKNKFVISLYAKQMSPGTLILRRVECADK
jgi:hypothetical protein